jgi:hypothetical protein
MNDELQGAMDYFKFPSKYFYGGTKEKYENIMSEPLPNYFGRESISRYPMKDLSFSQRWL